MKQFLKAAGPILKVTTSKYNREHAPSVVFDGERIHLRTPTASLSMPCHVGQPLALRWPDFERAAKAGFISATAEGATVTVTTPTGTMQMDAMPILDAPAVVPHDGETSTFSVEASGLIYRVKFASAFVATEKSRFSFNAYRVSRHTVIATNGKILGVAGWLDGDELPFALIDRTVLDGFLSLVAPMNTVHVSISSRSIRLTCGDVVVTEVIPIGSFPDYRAVIPKDRVMSGTVDAKELSSVASVAKKALKDESIPSVGLTFSETATVEWTNQGTHKLPLTSYDGYGEFAARFNPSYLLAIAKAFGKDSVLIEGSKPNQPIKLSSRHRLAVVMPIIIRKG